MSDTKVDTSVFVTEDNVFDVIVEYYKINNKIYVKGVHDDFDASQVSSKLNVALKYPSYGDGEFILSQAKLLYDSFSSDNLGVRDLLTLEFSRLIVLIRKWSLSDAVTKENIAKINPSIIKGLTNGIRNVIGMDGIL